MKKAKKTISVFLSVCLTVSALSCVFAIPSGLVSAEGSALNDAYTYNFADYDNTDSIEGFRKVTMNKNGGVFNKVSIYTDEDGDSGLGTGEKMLLIGNSYSNTNPTVAIGIAQFYNPADHAVANGDGYSLVRYPVTEMSVDIRIPNATNNSQKNGTLLSLCAADAAYNSENSYISQKNKFLKFVINANETYGYALWYGGVDDTFNYTPAEDGTISGVQVTPVVKDWQILGKFASRATPKSGATLAELLIDDDGNALTAADRETMATYFTNKKSLTNDELWVNIAAKYDSSNTELIFTLNLSGYADLRKVNSTLPEKIRVKLTIANTGYTQSGLGMIGVAAGLSNYSGVAVKNLTLKYDVSAAYAESAEEFKTKFAADYESLTADPLTSADKESVNTLLSDYDSLNENVKSIILTDDTTGFETKLSTLQAAQEALNNGADYFDPFEGALSWSLTSNIISEKNLIETNDYSDDAALSKPTGEEAFWGIHTDTKNTENKVLYLRKSLLTTNADPYNDSSQNIASVLYTFNDLSAGDKKVEAITGKMYFSTGGTSGNYYKRAIGGICYSYSSQYVWNAIAVSNYGFNDVKRTSNTTGTSKTLLYNESGESVPTESLTQNQWVDFEFKYNYSTGRYYYTLTGETASGVQSFTMCTPTCGLVSQVGLCHPSAAGMAFDNIAITLADKEDFKPEVLGAKILKQATETGDQNLRIDFNFGKSIVFGADKNINEYGVILQAGTQVNEDGTAKDTLLDSANTKRTVLRGKVTSVSEIPSLFTVTITNSAENAGKRVTAIAYVKDAYGNYYYSENTNEVVKNGIAVKSVMGIMKAWYLDMNTNESAALTSAAERYVSSDSPEPEIVANAAAAQTKALSYADGTVKTTDKEYGDCKEILSRIFYHFYNTTVTE